MVVHRFTKSLERRKKVGTVTVSTYDGRSTIKFGFWHKSWPKLANRLRSRGFSVEVLNHRNRIGLETNASPEMIFALVKPRRVGKVLPIVSVVAASLALASISPVKPSLVRPKQTVSNETCTSEWLLAEIAKEQSDPANTFQKRVQIGGVESGLVTCKGSKYSYTLDLGETKRVLRLVKLDA